MAFCHTVGWRGLTKRFELRRNGNCDSVFGYLMILLGINFWIEYIGRKSDVQRKGHMVEDGMETKLYGVAIYQVP